MIVLVYAIFQYINIREIMPEQSTTTNSEVTIKGKSTFAFVQDAAIHLMASASLNDIDNNGNLKPVPDAKAKAIAERCVKYAYMLSDALAAGKK